MTTRLRRFLIRGKPRKNEATSLDLPENFFKSSELLRIGQFVGEK